MIQDLQSFDLQELQLLIDRLNQSDVSDSDKESIRLLIQLLSRLLDDFNTLS